MITNREVEISKLVMGAKYYLYIFIMSVVAGIMLSGGAYVGIATNNYVIGMVFIGIVTILLRVLKFYTFIDTGFYYGIKDGFVRLIGNLVGAGYSAFMVKFGSSAPVSNSHFFFDAFYNDKIKDPIISLTFIFFCSVLFGMMLQIFTLIQDDLILDNIFYYFFSVYAFYFGINFIILFFYLCYNFNILLFIQWLMVFFGNALGSNILTSITKKVAY